MLDDKHVIVSEQLKTTRGSLDLQFFCHIAYISLYEHGMTMPL